MWCLIRVLTFLMHFLKCSVECCKDFGKYEIVSQDFGDAGVGFVILTNGLGVWAVHFKNGSDATNLGSDT